MSLEYNLLVGEYKANKNNMNYDDDRHYHFAICKICFWTATFLGIEQSVNNEPNACHPNEYFMSCVFRF
jgi:hypothetical protein